MQPSVTAIANATGVLEDGRLAKQTAGSFRRVAAGKVAGLQALERNVAALPTPGVVAFSSVSSIVAPLGQPNYASANASLCAWASAKAAQGVLICVLHDEGDTILVLENFFS